MRRFGSIPTPADAEEINWNELSPEEQASLIRQGYRPPALTIMSNAAYTELEERGAAISIDEFKQHIANSVKLPVGFLFPNNEG